MSEVQAMVEFSVELHKFYNVDLFQRGYVSYLFYWSAKWAAVYCSSVAIAEKKEWLVDGHTHTGGSI